MSTSCVRGSGLDLLRLLPPTHGPGGDIRHPHLPEREIEVQRGQATHLPKVTQVVPGIRDREAGSEVHGLHTAIVHCGEHHGCLVSLTAQLAGALAAPTESGQVPQGFHENASLAQPSTLRLAPTASWDALEASPAAGSGCLLLELEQVPAQLWEGPLWCTPTLRPRW